MESVERRMRLDGPQEGRRGEVGVKYPILRSEIISEIRSEKNQKTALFDLAFFLCYGHRGK